MIQPATLVLVVIGIVSANAFTTFQQQCLTAHNQLRAKHCAPDLVLDTTLCQVAQDYADLLAAKNIFEHSSNDYGENLYYSNSSKPIKTLPAFIPVQSWYDEKPLYNFDDPGFSEEAGHFTQVVWKTSKKVGCGIAFGPKNTSVFVVANYDPAGNYDGQFVDHVLPTSCPNTK